MGSGRDEYGYTRRPLLHAEHIVAREHNYGCTEAGGEPALRSSAAASASALCLYWRNARLMLPGRSDIPGRTQVVANGSFGWVRHRDRGVGLLQTQRKARCEGPECQALECTPTCKIHALPQL